MILLTTLLLAAAPNPKDAKCQSAFDAIDAATGMKKNMFSQMEKKYPDAAPNITKKFLDRCVALDDAAIACPAGKSGRELRDCTGVMEALQKAVAAFMEEKDPGSFERFELASMQTEPKANLRAISTGLKSLFFESTAVAQFSFPPSAPKTPADDCCKQPDKACHADAKTFSHPSFKTIGFQTEGKLRYAYEYTSKGKGPTATFTVKASGDPQCKGKKETWVVTGTVKGADLIVTDPTQEP